MSREKLEISDFVGRLLLLKGDRTQKEFAEWLSQSPVRINDYLTGKSASPAFDLLLRLAEKGVNIHWFVTGNGPVYIETGQDNDIPAEAQILLKSMIGDGARPEDLLDILHELKILQDLKQQTHEAYVNLKASFKRKKSKK